VNLNVKAGEVVGLLGPNGAGKTTTFYMIVGLIKPNQGMIRLNDEEITDFPCIFGHARESAIYPRKHRFSGNSR
jgi:lipopolysaccharide export system ATP-binding protein